MNRMSWDEYFIEFAFLTAKRSSCVRRQIGAVLVRDKRVIATGYNGAARGIQPCIKKGFCMREKEGIESGTKLEYCYAIHAEMNALLQCATYGMSSFGATVYLTHFPCPICTNALIQGGIKKIIYCHDYPSDFSRDLLSETDIEVERFLINSY